MEQTDKKTAYLKGRWDPQRKNYSKRSAFNKRCHLSLQLFISMSAIAIPVILLIPKTEDKLIPAILSALVAAAAATDKVFNFGDNWRNFRQTIEAMDQEKALFEAGAGPYNHMEDPDAAFKLFVERSESFMAKETGSYFQWMNANGQATPPEK